MSVSHRMVVNGSMEIATWVSSSPFFSGCLPYDSLHTARTGPWDNYTYTYKPNVCSTLDGYCLSSVFTREREVHKTALCHANIHDLTYTILHTCIPGLLLS